MIYAFMVFMAAAIGFFLYLILLLIFNVEDKR